MNMVDIIQKKKEGKTNKIDGLRSVFLFAKNSANTAVFE